MGAVAVATARTARGAIQAATVSMQGRGATTAKAVTLATGTAARARGATRVTSVAARPRTTTVRPRASARRAASSPPTLVRALQNGDANNVMTAQLLLRLNSLVGTYICPQRLSRFSGLWPALIAQRQTYFFRVLRLKRMSMFHEVSS